jgi:outer membrane protein assembly factor BamE (lipoprotein component of BamABCDE complex)
MVKAVRMVGRFGGLTAAIAVVALASGCTSLRSHQGYIIDADLVNSVQPGVDNRTSVMQTLGKPSFASQFNPANEWYYVARDSRNLAYMNPKARSQLTLKIAFDQKGVVSNITRTGLDQVASVRPYSKVTPTLGRKRSFFEELFGNIGSVGAAGAGTGGGDDSQP